MLPSGRSVRGRLSGQCAVLRSLIRFSIAVYFLFWVSSGVAQIGCKDNAFIFVTLCFEGAWRGKAVLVLVYEKFFSFGCCALTL